MIRALLGLCFIWNIVSSGFGASERVAGAGLIEASGSVEEVLMDLAKLPLEITRSSGLSVVPRRFYFGPKIMLSFG